MHDRPFNLLLGTYLLFLVMCWGLLGGLAQAAMPEGAAQHDAVPADLEGRDWVVSQFYVHDRLLWPHLQAVWVPRPHIKFEGGAIKGSPGCGEFSGSYSKSGDGLTISAKWTDDSEAPCSAYQKADSAKILEALAHVRSVGVEPIYWNSDSLLLNGDGGKIQIALSPMRSGKDFSELHDTYWHLAFLDGSTPDLAQVIIDIDQAGIGFSTPSYLIGFPFQYKLNGLEFYPAYTWGGNAKSNGYDQDRQIAQTFEKVLHAISSYKLSGSLVFFDKEGHSNMVLTSIPPTGLENRTWRIAKFRADTKKADGDGLIDATEPATVIFLNGRVKGSPGCGGWEGDYKLSGNHLEFHAGEILAGLCSRPDQIQSDFVQKAFKAGTQVELKENRVLLRGEDGRAQVLLMPF